MGRCEVGVSENYDAAKSVYVKHNKNKYEHTYTFTHSHTEIDCIIWKEMTKLFRVSEMWIGKVSLRHLWNCDTFLSWKAVFAITLPTALLTALPHFYTSTVLTDLSAALPTQVPKYYSISGSMYQLLWLTTKYSNKMIHRLLYEMLRQLFCPLLYIIKCSNSCVCSISSSASTILYWPHNIRCS